jgi:hypothetical protein
MRPCALMRPHSLTSNTPPKRSGCRMMWDASNVRRPCRSHLSLPSRHLRRQDQIDHVQSLRWCRATAPYCIKSRGLIRDIVPLLAREIAQLRDPIGERCLLPSGDVFRHCCSYHIQMLQCCLTECLVNVKAVKDKLVCCGPETYSAGLPSRRRKMTFRSVSSTNSYGAQVMSAATSCRSVIRCLTCSK